MNANQQQQHQQKSASNTNQQKSALSTSNNQQKNFNHSAYQQSNHSNSLNIPLNTSSYAVQKADKENSNQEKNLYFNNNKERTNEHTNLTNSTDTNQDPSGLKLEIHVTVNHQANDQSSNNQTTLNSLNNCINYPTNCTNVSTLSDLKKYRTDLRTRNHNADLQKETMISNDLYKNFKKNVNNKFNESQVDGLANRFDNQANLNNLNNLNNRNNSNNHNNNYLTPSPNSTLRKFRGDPSDMIGEIQKRKCCSMM